MEQSQALLSLFKALADASRLNLIGLLVRQPLTVEQLAEMLKLSPSTVSHHLSVLAQAGLVSARAESYYNVYRLEPGAMERVAQQVLALEKQPPAIPEQVDLDAYDRKVIANFTDARGRVKSFPVQRKKFEAILRYVLRVFEPGVRYSEKQVNELLGRFNEDTATLRRELVGYGWIKREGGGREYWLPENEPTPGEAGAGGKEK